MIKLGNKVKDIVTGYEGIAVSKVEYLNGCVQYCVKPKIDADGKMPEGQYIDVQQLRFVESGLEELEISPTGGVMSDTPRGLGLSNK